MNPLVEKDLLPLVIKHINDGFDYYSLMRVNKLCNEVCKKMLVHKQGESKKGKHRKWVEIPGAPGMINGKCLRKRHDGVLIYKHYYINNLKHGPCTNKIDTGFKFVYRRGQLQTRLLPLSKEIVTRIYNSKMEKSEKSYLVSALIVFLCFFSCCLGRKNKNS